MEKLYFRNLEVYQLAMEIVLMCYSMTNKFPEKEKFCLTSQMNRAAISIPSNIAEGMARKSTKDKTHFLNISYGSLMELVCQTEIANKLGYVSDSSLTAIDEKAKILSIKISNFMTRIEKQSKVI